VFDGPFGAIYSFYIERERLSRLIARGVWASDIGPFYESFEVLRSLPGGATVVDAPAGSGVALRALPRDADVRYVAVDISRAMLARTAARGLPQVECVEADAASIPVDDATADVFLSNFGLHCFQDPRAAVMEIGRVLKPGGRLVGSAIVPSRGRSGLLVKPNRGGFGRLAAVEEVERWLGEAGLRDVWLDRRGGFLYFGATSA
jgi:SAM-dependent methyltransferase